MSCPEPPRGIVQLRRWRPKTIEYASGPEPGDSIGTSVWYACQSRKPCTCLLSNSCRITSHALSARRRSHTLPFGCSRSSCSTDGPKPTGLKVPAAKMCLTSS